MNLRACSGNTCLSDGPYFDARPMIVSILSEGDLTTRRLMPVAQAITYPSQNLSRKYDKHAEDEGQIVGIKQHSFFLHNEGSIEQLVSHTLTRCVPAKTCSSCSGVLVFSSSAATYQLVPIATNPADCKHLSNAEQDARFGKKVHVVGKRFVNKTPFWVFMVPTDVIPNHTDVFNNQTAALVQGILSVEIKSGNKGLAGTVQSDFISTVQ